MSDMWSHSHDWDNGYAKGHKDGYQQGKADANLIITPTIREIHDGVFQQGIDIGIEMSAKAFGYIYDGDCENCPAESECEFGKPCIETLKEYIKNFNKENK